MTHLESEVGLPVDVPVVEVGSGNRVEGQAGHQDQEAHRHAHQDLDTGDRLTLACSRTGVGLL